MKKILFFSLLLGIGVSADSLFVGKYLCNSKQFVEITHTALFIAGSEFTYNQTMKKPKRPTADIFLKGNEVAFFGPQPNREGHYSLNIMKIKNGNQAPYVADCVKE